MREIRVIIWGFGAMGSGMAAALLEKGGVTITGVCDAHPERVGRSMFDILGVARGDRRDVLITERIEDIVSQGSADVALLATDSFTRKAFDKIIYLVENRINVISTAEEMAYPRASEPELSEKIDERARQMGVSVLGTGINPGLIMDLLVVLLTGACTEVRSIRAERVNSLSPFGKTVMDEQGVGLPQAEFERRLKDGSLAGHVGFNESVAMICDALGWKLSEPVRQTQEAIISQVHRKSQYAEVKPGEAAGCNQHGEGFVDGEMRIEMVHPQQIEPEDEGVKTGDYITITGTPDISMQIRPEVPGGIGTIAMCINMIPHIINARPGLKTMLDLPVPRAVMGDMRHGVDPELLK